MHAFSQIEMPERESIRTESRLRFSSVVDPEADPHINGEYLKKNPTWHIEYSPWKAENVVRLLAKHNLHPHMIGDVGCGVAEVLRQLQIRMPAECRFWGYDIAPAAIQLAKQRENERLTVELADFGAIDTPYFDLALVLEVVDHIEEYLGFLRMLRTRAEWKVIGFSLDITVLAALRTGIFTKWRDGLSHLHHFNKEIALDTLRHTGYQVVDYCYGPWPNQSRGLTAGLLRRLRGITFRMDQDLSARIFGGSNLVVLAR
jgi:hypothetical protein